eukprot:5490680-Amphidinium_carterae.2
MSGLVVELAFRALIPVQLSFVLDCGVSFMSGLFDFMGGYPSRQTLRKWDEFKFCKSVTILQQWPCRVSRADKLVSSSAQIGHNVRASRLDTWMVQINKN